MCANNGPKPCDVAVSRRKQVPYAMDDDENCENSAVDMCGEYCDWYQLDLNCMVVMPD